MVGAVGDLMAIDGKGAAKMPKAKFNGHSCTRSAGRRRSIVMPAPTSGRMAQRESGSASMERGCSPRGRDELHARRVRSPNEFTATTGISNNGSYQFHGRRRKNGNDLRICLWATRPSSEPPPPLHARAGLLRKLLEMKKSLGSPGFALPFDVSRLISRGLGRKSKYMRKVLIMSCLQSKLQVLDFLMVRKKKGVFRCISHP
jgi:hypothetical protein